MQPAIQTKPVSKGRVWTGRVLSGLAVLFLLFDGIMKILKVAPVLETHAQLGIPDVLARPIGVLELLCVLVYLIPQTSVLGAILLTGYLGGAVMTHVRVESPLFSHVLFPTYVAALIWGGLVLRDDRLLGVILFREPND